MTRIHPSFAPDIEGKTTSQATKMLIEAYQEGTEYWINFIFDEIGYIGGAEIPIIIMSLRKAADHIAKRFPEADVTADIFGKFVVVQGDGTEIKKVESAEEP